MQCKTAFWTESRRETVKIRKSKEFEAGLVNSRISEGVPTIKSCQNDEWEWRKLLLRPRL
jgi:hypothetical protein